MNTPAAPWKTFLRKPQIYISAILITGITAYFAVLNNNQRNEKKFNPAFSSYIAAYSSGTLSKESTIRIQLAGNFSDSSKIGTETAIFSFSPSIKGKATWIDASTIEFKPSQPMPSGTQYEAVFHLDKLMEELPDDLKEFPFQFNIIEQSFEVQTPFFESMDRQTLIYQRVSGTLLTADAEQEENVERLLKAKQDGVDFSIKWEHAADKRTHRYVIDSVVRKNTSSQVNISWNGNPIDVDLTGEHVLTIPALGDFKVVHVAVEHDGEQYVSIRFSDPLLTYQDLNGLIYFNTQGNTATQTDLRFSVHGNEIKCYPGIRMLGSHLLIVSSGIKNVLEQSLPDGFEQRLDFADMMPAVSFVGKGVIMPASNRLMLPFEAVGLNAVDITVIKIYENNIAQFLQVNDLTGNREMVRVGRPVLRKTMKLDNDRLVDLRKPNRFAIELDKFIRTEPGAIYNVKISFKKSYSLYRCDASKQTETLNDEEMKSLEEDNWDALNENEFSYWDYTDYYDNDYNWNERDNPCHNSYYNPQRFVSRNILASDLGIIAKRGTSDAYTFAVTDLRTTKPISGVKLDLLNFQQQLINSVQTDENGMASVTAAAKPFLLVAKHNEQRGYLKLDDGSSLPLSHFDVSGDIVQKGLKGFIYGERGVWRPGDSIYLTFILEDRNHTLPPSHPVSLELFDPNGALHKRLVQSKSVNGFFSFHTSTDASAPTGNWSAKIKVGGVTFQKTLKVETVMPNRLKIDLTFKTPYLHKSSQVDARLVSRWLHGAIADGLDAKVDVTLTPATTAFSGFNQFVFDDPTRKFSADIQTIFNGKLDANGAAQIKSAIAVENRSSGMLNANFTTKVFEAGGNFSIDRFSIPFHPYDVYVGLKVPKGDETRGMLLTDTNHTVQVVCVDKDGKPTKGKRTVKINLYKINWRWWWDKSEEDLSAFAENEEYQALQESDLDLIDGKGKWTLRVNYPDWGRYLVRITDADGHSAAKILYIDWPGWAGRAQRDNAVEATMLTFTTDKKIYKVGESASLVIPSSKGGRALVSIESGSKVIETHWVETQQAQTRYTFNVTKDMLPNAFIHITLLQPHAQTVNDLPIRLYGMIPIKIEDPASILKPVISMSDQLKPDENATIRIAESTGKPMTYTLAVVDEGLLDLTRFKTPDPHAQFYAREALGVKTWDMYDYVMGAFGMQMNRILSIGGDEGINKKASSTKANRFKPVVKFLGPFHLNGGSTAAHQLKIEDYVGSVRVMVVAGENGAYGFTEKAVPVKKPLMVLATIPRVLSPTETVRLPVTVFAMEPAIKNVKVQVQGNNLVEFVNGDQQNIYFTKPGDEFVYFDVKVKSMLGIAKLKVTATSGNHQATYAVELDVRNPNPIVHTVYDGATEAGKSWTARYTPEGMTGTNSAVLEVSSIPPLNLDKRLKYLIQYPHGCVEQTTSAVFPQLALNNLLDLNAGVKKQIEQNIKTGIQRLRTFQTADGGLAYWPAENRSDEWSTSYAGHFMVEAQNNGYALPVNFLANWKKFQRNKALTWTSYETGSNDMIQAYRLYTLALAKAPELGAMNRLKELKNLSTAAKWRLAATYVLIGQKSTAQQLIRNLPIIVAPYQEMDMTYGSDLRDQALILETLVLLEDKIAAGKIMQSICQQLGTDMWMSTQTTAYALISIARLAGKYADRASLDFSYTHNGRTQVHHSNAQITQIPITITGRNQGSVKVTSTNGKLLFTRLILQGQPEMGQQLAAQQNLGITVNYMNLDNQKIDPTLIAQGTDFKAEVTISNPGMFGNYAQMALTQIFPSGWEILNARMGNIDGTSNAYSIPRYQDVRDDRVLTYFNVPAKQKVTYVVWLNASYLGRFYLPGTSCEAMYNGQIAARTAGTWVEVVPSTKQVAKR